MVMSFLRTSIAVLGLASALLSAASPSARPSEAPRAASRMHTYFIAADEVAWDFAPRGRALTGAATRSIDDADSVRRTTYLKAIYREYTDDTFTTLKPRSPAWEHLGMLGPLLRAEVGDTIRVVYRNNTNGFFSMHPHGLAYDKASEGALYNDGTLDADKRDDRIPPGAIHVYLWTVPPRAGPGPHDPSSVLWMYHSHFVEPTDMNTGLLGPIIVSASGSARPDGSPTDVDREFVAAFAIYDETASAYVDKNIVLNSVRAANLKVTDPGLRRLHLMYSINGFIDGNLPLLTMKKGERVRWYLMSNSNDEDVHGAHWHGQTAVAGGMRTDTVPLAPMGMTVADMIPDGVGTWLFHCHVNDHFEGGMQALFRVVP